MDRLDSARLQAFRDLFSPSDNLSYLEIWNFKDMRRNVIAHDRLGENKSLDWFLRQADVFHEALEGLRIIFTEGFNRHQHPIESKLTQSPLQMCLETFLCISSAFSLPLSFIRMLRESSTVFMDMKNASNSVSGIESKPNIFAISELEIDYQLTGFMIQNSHTSTAQFSAAISYEPARCLTSVLLHGLSGDEINSLITELIAHREDISLPMLLPSLLVGNRVVAASTKVRECHQRIVEVEEETGVQTNWNPTKSYYPVHQRQHQGNSRYDFIDFHQVTNDLTSLSSTLAYCEYLVHIHLPMLKEFDHISLRHLESTAEKNKETLQRVYARLRMENEFLRSSLAGILCRAQFLTKRTQAQVQTIYSMIAQKDNSLSMKDNAALKRISEDQKRIALAATRDSAAIRVISVITAVFLPGTFTAALFSTTFFDFQGDRGGPVVSHWVWLYFLVTVALGIVIFLYWYITARYKFQEIESTFGDERKNQKVEMALN